MFTNEKSISACDLCWKISLWLYKFDFKDDVDIIGLRLKNKYLKKEYDLQDASIRNFYSSTLKY